MEIVAARAQPPLQYDEIQLNPVLLRTTNIDVHIMTVIVNSDSKQVQPAIVSGSRIREIRCATARYERPTRPLAPVENVNVVLVVVGPDPE